MGLPFFSPQPCLPALAVHAQIHTAKITSSGIAPESPRRPRRAEPGGKQSNAPASPRRSSRSLGRRAAKLASGLRGRGLDSAGCYALGSHPRRRPRLPRPQTPHPPPPHRRSWMLRGAKSNRLPAAAALGRWRAARPLHSGRWRWALGTADKLLPLCSRTQAAGLEESTRAGVPGTRGWKGRSWGARGLFSF